MCTYFVRFPMVVEVKQYRDKTLQINGVRDHHVQIDIYIYITYVLKLLSIAIESPIQSSYAIRLLPRVCHGQTEQRLSHKL